MHKLFAALVFITFLACQPTEKSATEINDLIPDNASVVIKIKDLESFKSDRQSSTIFSNKTSVDFYDSFKSQLFNLDSVQSNNEIALVLGSDQSNTLITKIGDSTQSYLFKNKDSVFKKEIDSYFVASNSEQALNLIKTGTSLFDKKLISYEGENKSFTIGLRPSFTSPLINLFINDTITQHTINSVLNVEAQTDQIIVNGISISNDTLPHYETIFENQIPSEITLQKITPKSADGFMSMTFTNFDDLKNNLDKLNQNPDSTLVSPIIQTSSEIGVIHLNNNQVIALKSIDITTTRDAMVEWQDEISNFRDVPIYNFDDQTIFSSLKPIISSDSLNTYGIIDDYLVFSNSKQAIESVIADYKNNNTIAEDATFIDCMKNLSDESSLFMVAKSEMLSQRLSKFFTEPLSSSAFVDYKMGVVQWIQDDGFSHFNTVISKEKKSANFGAIAEVFNVSVDNAVITSPQFVINHRTRQKEIIVQDANNILYLISNSGKILWKKQLLGKILGDVEQVDLYKNGRLQLAFATSSRVYVIDRNGNDVLPFPLKFNDEITQPLSIFDYDKNKRYRFLVVQKNEILIYDSKGKIVKGFDYKSSGLITSQPKHFRINSKDYIVFVAGGNLKILNRRGRIRIPNNTSFNHSGNAVFWHKNTFCTSSEDGDLIQVNASGRSSKQSLGLQPYHTIDATSKTLVTLSDNVLNIKQNTIELDFSNYSQPKIFYINDKIYVTVTNLQDHKILLYDSQAKPIVNFPVYGNSLIDFDNIDGDSKLEFVTVGDENSIIVYKKN